MKKKKNLEIYKVNDIDIVTPMHNLIEYSEIINQKHLEV